MAAKSLFQTTENEIAEVQRNLLVTVIDVNPMQRIAEQVMTQLIDSTIVFSNAHLMQSPNNVLATIACHGGGARFLYPDNSAAKMEIRQFDGQHEKFTLIEKTVREKVKQTIQETPADKTLMMESLISGALSMALCYISRLDREKVAGEKLNARILVVTASHDSAKQYMNYMNIFFTAQKMGVILDVCSLDQELSLLQQGCDITGGNYLKIPQLAGLLQYLLWVFLPDPDTRFKLVLPPPVKVDYRAACFCHQELVDIGYVCSVCLSIFCKGTPICTTCHTVFKMPGPMPIKKMKKKKPIDIVP